MTFNNLKEFAEYLCTDSDDLRRAFSLMRQGLFKNTKAGLSLGLMQADDQDPYWDPDDINVAVPVTGIAMTGIVEGDGDIELTVSKLFFPFTLDQYDQLIASKEEEHAYAKARDLMHCYADSLVTATGATGLCLSEGNKRWDTQAKPDNWLVEGYANWFGQKALVRIDSTKWQAIAGNGDTIGEGAIDDDEDIDDTMTKIAAALALPLESIIGQEAKETVEAFMGLFDQSAGEHTHP